MSASISLRTRQFQKIAKSKGLTTDTAIAAAVGCDRGNLSRVLAGKQAPGARFIAGTLAAFPEWDFEDLFEVVVTDVEAA